MRRGTCWPGPNYWPSSPFICITARRAPRRWFRSTLPKSWTIWPRPTAEASSAPAPPIIPSWKRPPSRACPWWGNRTGGSSSPPSRPIMDAMMSTAKLMEFIALEGKPISSYLQQIPKKHEISQKVPCSWEMKGTIMRHLIEDTEKLQRELIDGVKITPKRVLRHDLARRGHGLLPRHRRGRDRKEGQGTG